MPVIQAQDIVNAAIQDSQVQTTNRVALYDYVDRTHQRILRESQWRFLLSDPKVFTTMPGVSNYNVTSNTSPPGVFQTNLNISNFYCFAPGSVFDLTHAQQIQEDSDVQTSMYGIVYKDGSLRQGPPRTYSNSIAYPGVISLKPVPDAENLYYPVPETPVVTFEPLAGCTLPQRIYYGVVTFVDSLGGESTQCNVPICVVIPAGNVLTVESPNPVPGMIAGDQAFYSGWNLYLGTSLGNYVIQNTTPISIGTNWTENILGMYKGLITVPSTASLPFNETLTINNTGTLTTTPSAIVSPPLPYALVAPNGSWWELIAYPILMTQEIAPTIGIMDVTTLYLTDVQGISTWAITVENDGQLQSTIFSTPPTTQPFAVSPPQFPTIQPLNAYIIQFRYYQSRNQISNPTDVLQIPYAYKDIVISGVNYLASLYMDIQANREPSAKTIIWRRDFDQGLSQIRRDLRINFRKTDFVSPDPTTQYVVGNQQGIPTQGW